MSKMLTLEEWAQTVYGEHPPAMVTLRRWAREARIYPAPEKHGRAYFVRADARYIDPSKPVPAPAPAAKPAPRSLVERIRNGTAA